MKTVFRPYRTMFFRCPRLPRRIGEKYDIPLNWFIDRWNFRLRGGQDHELPEPREWASHIGLWADEGGRIIAIGERGGRRREMCFPVRFSELAQGSLIRSVRLARQAALKILSA